MVLHVAWIALVILTAIMLSRRPIRNCQGCAWRTPGQCKHPTASQVPELLELQIGHYRCPWKEVIRRG